MNKLKIGDTVKIIIGKDKGREGKIERIFPKNRKALIPGINMYKKHVKGFKDVKGGIYDLSRPLLLSKVMLVCSKCKKVTRIGIRQVGETKVRFCKKCNKEI